MIDTKAAILFSALVACLAILAVVTVLMALRIEYWKREAGDYQNQADRLRVKYQGWTHDSRLPRPIPPSPVPPPITPPPPRGKAPLSNIEAKLDRIISALEAPKAQ